MKIPGGKPLLRERRAHEHGRVTFIELFFDLVFVFAITQLSHHLLEHFTPAGALQTLIMFLAVWWVWIYTSWVTNWLDPERTPVRLLLLALMLAGLVLSTSIPHAFEGRGLTFALAYAGMQVGRSVFMMLALQRDSPAKFHNFRRITIWLAVSGTLWIAGGALAGEARLLLWGAALAIEFAGPPVFFYVPGLGRSSIDDWDVEGGHLAERCALFIIIALGESILVTGATFDKLPWTAATIAAFGVSFVGSVAMWWIYFDTGAERGSRRLVEADDPGRLARLAYTYIHLLIVAGIVVTAVGDELVLAHPDGHTDAKVMLTVLGGPALYLVGTTLFKRAVVGHLAPSHLIGLGLMALAALTASLLSPLAFSAVVAGALIVVAVWEARSLRDLRASRAR